MAAARLSPADWVGHHTDAFHPQSREECSFCQDEIRCYGPMPSIQEIEAATLRACQEYERRRIGIRPRKAIISTHLRWLVWERDNFTCLRCGARQDLTIDHIEPESKGGATTEENLQTLCRRCNSRKAAA